MTQGGGVRVSAEQRSAGGADRRGLERLARVSAFRDVKPRIGEVSATTAPAAPAATEMMRKIDSTITMITVGRISRSGLPIGLPAGGWRCTPRLMKGLAHQVADQAGRTPRSVSSGVVGYSSPQRLGAFDIVHSPTRS